MRQPSRARLEIDLSLGDEAFRPAREEVRVCMPEDRRCGSVLEGCGRSDGLRRRGDFEFGRLMDFFFLLSRCEI